MKNKFIKLIAIILLIPLLVGVFFFKGRKVETDRNLEIIEGLELKEQSSYPIEFSYPGRVYSKRKTDLSFELAGTIAEFYYDDGDFVNKGTTIAALNTEKLEAQRRKIIAQKNQVEYQMKLLKVTKDRAKKLEAQGAISRQEYDESNFNYQSKFSELDSLNAQIDIIDSDISKAYIVAPFSGKLSNKVLDDGAIINPGTPVISIFENNQPEIRVGIPSNQKLIFKQGGIYNFSLENQNFEARLNSFLPNLDPSQRTVTAVFGLNPKIEFSEGEFVYLKLSKSVLDDVFYIPQEALSQGVRGLWNLMKLNSEDDTQYQITNLPVEIIHLSDTGAYVKGPIKNGDLIVKHGTHKLVPGQRVKLKNS
ncbi:MAG: efflux RND transporter periplasmic adaptor subunit [Candidatus Caenarcaniphilales bacterium]|nr:efflux RND transporter periplasmic adaptor subunit [Candidatus Caenarcaniphilales bacterium]